MAQIVRDVPSQAITPGFYCTRLCTNYGFSNQAGGDDPHDGLELVNCRIINAVKCLPPQNKPNGEEIKRCNRFLRNEIINRKPFTVYIALGAIAHGAVLSAFGLKKSTSKFAHGARVRA